MTNSAGQVEDLTLSFREMADDNKAGSSVQIVLSDYLVYTKVGEEISARSYIQEVTVNGYEYDRDYVNIDSDVDMDKPGTYIITYSMTMNGRTGMCDLIVVVEE